jgi:hypothetical protein
MLRACSMMPERVKEHGWWPGFQELETDGSKSLQHPGYSARHYASRKNAWGLEVEPKVYLASTATHDYIHRELPL